MAGLLVAIEGPDGAGKSTLAAGLARVLRTRGHVVRETKEPWDTPAGDRVRRGVGSLRDAISDRDHHVSCVIAPALARGEIVISDRYYASTVVHQGMTWRDAAARWPRPLWVHVVTPEATRRARVIARGEEPPDEEVVACYSRLPWSPLPVFASQSGALQRASVILEIERLLTR